jgi:hypothetical protein
MRLCSSVLLFPIYTQLAFRELRHAKYSRGRVPLLFLAYDDFFRSAKLNEKYDRQNPSGKRVYANEADKTQILSIGFGLNPIRLRIRANEAVLAR